ncbi:TPA: hypothetical protein N0F65_004110 [Lagenidium giganteum]|uniref:mitogen-activated protein kinase kinase n=1 Tax=Lagenidium giganteum TaxID=4803 RepID=A0AAV2ZF09_9STRA|nr:TPA: hypothetical protein N0F65_004110 [Lagenidium giganteum]
MHIHSKGVVHCDLKPENVLVSDSGRIALCDFGISSDVGPNNSNVTTTMIAGTPGYMAPYADWKRNPTALDVWSLGCMMLELLLPVFAEIPGVIPTRQRLATYLTVGEVPIQDIDWIKLVDFFSAPHMNAYARLCSQLLVPDVMDALSVHEVLLTDVFVAVDTTQSTGLETRWQTVLTAISRVRKANKTPVVLSVTSSLSSMDPSHANADVFCTEVVEKLTTSVSDLRILLRIVDGQGALVPLNEVVELFFRRVVLPQYGLFTQSFEGTLNGDAKTKQEEPVHSQESQRAFVPAVHAKRTHPEAVGKLIAKCVIERVRVPLVLNSATLEFMLGRPERRTSLDDALDILRETCDDEMYMLFHSVARQLCVEQRQLRVCDLDGSSNVEPVTSANKVRVLQDAIWHKLVHQRHASLESLRRGFRCGGLEHVLESVSGKELQDLFFGNDFIDLRDIRQSICFTDANWTDKAAMNAMRTWLLQWLTNANEMTRRVFLIRCVSTCALRKVPTIYVVQSDDDLVHVASGSQSLYLPVVGDTDLPEFEKHFRAQLLLEYVDETVCTKCHSTIASQDERVHCEYSHINCTTCVLHKVMSVVDGTAVVRRAQDLALVCGKLGCSSKLNDGQVVRVVPEHDMTTFRQLFREMAPCCICLTDEPRCIGTTCYQGHFVCYEMLEGKLKSELIQIANNETLINAERLVSNKGLVKCPSVDCPERWNIGVLLPRLTLETRNQLLTCLVTYSRTEEEAQEERRATEARLVRLRAEEDMRLDERVHGLRQHIVEELLHSKCPHCRALFVDYNACDALHCASDQNAAYGCKRSFCAICLQPFADSDATHTHVRSAHGIYFGGNRFQEASRDRKTRLVRDFLATIGDQNVLRCVREAIRLDLRDIGIVIGE